MRHATVVLLAVLAGAALASEPAVANSPGRHEVFGVEGDDMLKLRAGPGVGYVVVAGFPNGTILRVHSCQQTGGTRWCSVSMEQARGLRGYVSAAYLRRK